MTEEGRLGGLFSPRRSARETGKTGLIISAFAALFAGGCVHAHAMPVVLSQAVIDQEQQGVVAVAATLDDDPSHVTLCSGALVAPNLVLTARHCVSRAITATPACDARGESHNGLHLADDADPSTIAIYVGAHVHVDRDPIRAHAIRTLHPDRARPLRRRRRVPRPRSPAYRCHGAPDPAPRNRRVGRPRPPRWVRRRSREHHRQPRGARREHGPRGRARRRTRTRARSSGRASSRSMKRPAAATRAGRRSTRGRARFVGVVSRGASCSAPGNHVYTRVDAYAQLAAAAFAAAEGLAGELRVERARRGRDPSEPLEP